MPVRGELGFLLLKSVAVTCRERRVERGDDNGFFSVEVIAEDTIEGRGVVSETTSRVLPEAALSG
jgi:hypothetical protein